MVLLRFGGPVGYPVPGKVAGSNLSPATSDLLGARADVAAANRCSGAISSWLPTSGPRCIVPIAIERETTLGTSAP